MTEQREMERKRKRTELQVFKEFLSMNKRESVVVFALLVFSIYFSAVFFFVFCVCVCVCVCVCEWVSECVCVCVCLCLWVCVFVQLRTSAPETALRFPVRWDSIPRIALSVETYIGKCTWEEAVWNSDSACAKGRMVFSNVCPLSIAATVSSTLLCSAIIF